MSDFNRHLTADETELWAEGLLPAARAIHLAQCAQCLAIAERERRFFLELARVERLAPGGEFAEKVMGSVRVAVPKP